jgi:hypothetical protein
MANDRADNQQTPVYESCNPMVDMRKSINPAVSLAQTIAQPQTPGTGTAAAHTVQNSNQSSGDK